MEQIQQAEKTLSPYFFVQSDDPATDQLPLKSTAVAVNIAGVIADVIVTQIYTNTGTRPIEAIYVFPASTRAAVYGMTMTIGARTIVAVIKERQQARQDYEDAKRAGKSASLLEQQRPNVFQMNVANIMPGDEIKVELKYTELLIPTDGVYEFVYPTVVGPRYSNQPEATAPRSEQWVSNPYLPEGQAGQSTFGITVTLAAGLPVQEMLCPSHQTTINYESQVLANVKLAASEQSGGNRDFILKYRLSGGQIESGLLLYKGETENFFLLMLQPPQRVIVEQIPPREYIFILDVSGSMHGFPLDTAKVLLQDLMSQMRPTDRFNVLLFSFGSGLLAKESLAATPDSIQKGLDLIKRQRGGGGTELLPALQQALKLPRTDNISRTVIIVTDGFVDVEPQAFDLIRQHLADANLFAFGIGSSVNRHLIEGMARVGMGEPFIVTHPNQAPTEATKLRRYIESPVLTRIKADFRDFAVTDIEPLSIPDVLAQRPVIVFGKWQGEPAGTVTISGFTGGQPYQQTIKINGVLPLESNSALRYLWARHKIALLNDYNQLQSNDERVKEITSLGLTYNLLTAYTSFVAVDSEVRNTSGETATIKQPLPLPEGVSNYAVGAGMPMGMVRAAAPAPSQAYFAKSVASYQMESLEEDGFALRDVEFGQVLPEEMIEGFEDERIQPAASGAKVTLGEGCVSDAALASGIETALRALLPALEQAYQRLLQQRLPFAGKIVVSFTIHKRHTQDVQLASTEVHVPDLEKFLIKSIESLHFREMEHLADVAVSWAFVFSNV